MNDMLKNFIDEIKMIPGFVAVSITEIESGVAYESYTANKDFDPNLAAAYNLEVVKAKINAIEALELTEEIQDITITLSTQVHIINIAPSNAYFIYLAVDSKNANLGITKALLSKHKKELYLAI